MSRKTYEKGRCLSARMSHKGQHRRMLQPTMTFLEVNWVAETAGEGREEMDTS